MNIAKVISCQIISYSCAKPVPVNIVGAKVVHRGAWNVEVSQEVKTQHEKNDAQSEEGCTAGQGDGVGHSLNQDASETR